MRVMLSKGDTALVCPGGVRECTYMRKGREAVFLTSRTGFVRIAMQYGESSASLKACFRGALLGLNSAF